MLTEQLTQNSVLLNKLEIETFKKVINYVINLIRNQENRMKINEFIEIQEEKGEQLTSLTLNILIALCKFRSNSNEIYQEISLLRMDKDKSEYLKQKIKENMHELRKVIHSFKLSELTQLRDLEWRFELEIASKSSRNRFEPNILLNFKIQEGEQVKDNLVNCNYANLKNLQQSLTQAIKLQGSSKFKTARNSST